MGEGQQSDSRKRKHNGCYKSSHTGRSQKPNRILLSLPHLCALLLEELGVYLLANDLGANVILDSDAKPHLFQDKLHLLLLLHGAIGLHLDRNTGTFSKLTYFPLNKCCDICPD